MDNDEKFTVSYRPNDEPLGEFDTEEEANAAMVKDIASRLGIDADVVEKVRHAIKRQYYFQFPFFQFPF